MYINLDEIETLLEELRSEFTIEIFDTEDKLAFCINKNLYTGFGGWIDFMEEIDYNLFLVDVYYNGKLLNEQGKSEIVEQTKQMKESI